jgi:hypothetical protein
MVGRSPQHRAGLQRPWRRALSPSRARFDARERFQFVPCKGCINLRAPLQPVMGGEGAVPSPASSRHGSCRTTSCRQAWRSCMPSKVTECCRKSRQHPAGTQRSNHRRRVLNRTCFSTLILNRVARSPPRKSFPDGSAPIRTFDCRTQPITL